MKDEDGQTRVMSRGLKTLLVALCGVLLVSGATAVEIAVRPHTQRPLVGSVAALAILNINVLLIVLLTVLIGRQFVKFYFERKTSPSGAGFRTKIVTALTALSIIPSVLLFVIAATLLTGGVGYWFGPRVESTVKDSMELVKSYREDRLASAGRYAATMADGLRPIAADRAAVKQYVASSLAGYGLDLVEVFSTTGVRKAAAGAAAHPYAESGGQFIKKVAAEGRASVINFSKQGDVVRAGSVYRDGSGRIAGVVVAVYVLSPVISGNIADITRFYQEYWDLRTFKNPLKESYILSFMLITLLIVFAAVWFGLYVSRTITVPITSLAEATNRISKGEYDFPLDVQASDEIGVLVDSFRRMTMDLNASREKLSEANRTLTATNELLELRRQFIETVLENVNTGVVTIDRAGRITTVNRAAGRIMDLDTSTIGKNYREVFSFHQLDEVREEVREMADSRSRNVERDIQITVNGRTLTLRLFVTALYGTGSDYLGILIVFDDLTELMKAQRAAAWKEVARRIAHEVKNPLTPIQLSAQRLRKRYQEGAADFGSIVEDCTETIIRQVEGMKSLVDEFSKFARMPEAKPEQNDMHEVIEEAIRLFTGAHKDVEFAREYDETLPTLNVDGGQMHRVFVNLFDNAVAAMDGKGTITVTTAYDEAGNTAKISVSDEGGGILPEDREMLFQPYFSRNKSGTGLGLAIVSRIISDHGGYIRAESNQPKGARFIIELPVRG